MSKVGQAIEAQEQYCEEHEVPLFAPINGRCEACGLNIYNMNGYSPKYARSFHITCCPHCGRSFCD